MATQNNISSKWILAVLLMAGSAFFTEVRAHGVQIDTSIQPPYISIQANFSRTSPMKDALVSIMAPGNDSPWQTGRTDMSGNFAFMPDKAGSWVVVIDDEQGHRGRTTIEVAEGFFTGSGPYASTTGGTANTEHFVVEGDHTQSAEKPTMEKEVIVETTVTKNIPIIYRAIFGLSLIFGITGIAYGMMMHRKGKLSEKK